MRTLRLTIAYDGTEFHGWQVQPGMRTVEGVVRDALGGMLGACGDLTAASRTDAGVHARGQTVSLSTGSEIDCVHLARGLNRHLPADVAIVACQDAAADFSARRNLGKHYRYALWLADYDDPLGRRYHWWYRYPLDCAAMQAAAPLMTGTHEMRGLQMVSGKTHEESVRTVHAVSVTCEGARLAIDVTGQSFMYKQVRAMTGVLVAVGRGRIAPEDVPAVLAGSAGARRFDVAPPQGLTLMEVKFPDAALHETIQREESIT